MNGHSSVNFSDTIGGSEFDENPCLTCQKKDYCDSWEARYCCALCHYNRCENCDNCNPMDI